MSDFDQDAFDRWLEAQSPEAPKPAPPPILSFLAAAAASVPVLSHNALTGSKAQEALQLDSAYANAPPSDSVAKLQQSPATGCTMMLTLAREKSGYNPDVPAQTSSTQDFLNYVNSVLESPIFSTVLNDHIAPTFSGNWNSVIAQIAGYYVGIPASDVDVLKKSLVAIGAAASSNPSTNQTMNMFSQATMNVDSTIGVYMYHTYVQMKTTVHHGGKHEPDTVSQQAAMSLYRVHLDFNSAQWAAQAAQVHQKTQTSLNDWLKTNTPIGFLPAGWHPS